MEFDFGNTDSIKSAGFTGFRSVADLRDSLLRDVPEVPGVYLALRPPLFQPNFLECSVGGHFKGKDPTVPRSDLEANWVEGTPVLYIGKAGGSGGKATLRRRLRDLLRFGAGKVVGHWGGRYIWQLQDSDLLQICWKPTPDREPRAVERDLIGAFRDQFGCPPFANLSD